MEHVISLDSITPLSSIDALLDFKDDYFIDKTTKYLNGSVHKVKLAETKEVLGLKSILITESIVKLELSSKILRADYLEGINLNTIEQVLDIINKTGIVTLDKNVFIENATLRKADFTDNIVVDNLDKTLLYLHTFPLNNKYHRVTHPTGLAITSTRLKKKDRLIFYGKYQDLEVPSKANKELLKVFDIEKAKNILRVENNGKDFNSLRKAIGIDKTKSRKMLEKAIKGRQDIPEPVLLTKILSSNSNVNYNMFNKVFSLNEKIKPEYYNNIDLVLDANCNQTKLEKILGMRSIILLCNHDPNAIKIILRKNVKGNISRKYKEYRDLMRIMNLEKLDLEIEKLDLGTDPIKEMKEFQTLLKAV